MHILLSCATYVVLALLCTVANLKLACLVICAVGAGDELLELRLEGEVCLKIVLLRSGVV